MNQASVYSSIVPVLPAERPVQRRGRLRGAALHDAAQQVRHDERRVGTDRFVRLGPVLLEHVAFTIGDRQITPYGAIRTPRLANAE